MYHRKVIRIEGKEYMKRLILLSLVLGSTGISYTKQTMYIPELDMAPEHQCFACDCIISPEDAQKHTMLLCSCDHTAPEHKKTTKHKRKNNYCSMLDYLQEDTNRQSPSYISKSSVKKKSKWVFCIYMAGRNDLHPFARANLRQLLSIGSNENISIVIDLHEPGKKGVERYYIEKNNPVLLYKDPQKVDSGDPQSVIDFIRFVNDRFEGDNWFLGFWDHGTSGSLDPHIARSLETSDIFNHHSTSNLFGQGILSGFPEYITEKEEYKPIKGCCFDDVYRTYLNNQSLDYALSTIKNEIFHGKKWNIIGYDACLMADVATASLLTKYADYQVSSEETEPGTGWRYDLVLLPFTQTSLEPIDFARHIVDSYARAYCLFINDYTQSAIDLEKFVELEKNINEVGTLLSECLHLQKNRLIKEMLAHFCFKPRFCTSFYEPSLKDLGHLWNNILKHVDIFQFNDDRKGDILKAALKSKLDQGISLIKESVVANEVGKSYPNAMGISIYCPEKHMHSSHVKTTFFKTGNAWCSFMQQYLVP